MIPREIIRNLPAAIIYEPESNMGALRNAELCDGDFVQCGDFKIDIEAVTKQQLIKMRRLLPQDEYRLIKNRKSARICRRKRKMERGNMQEELKKLQDKATEQNALLGQLEREKQDLLSKTIRIETDLARANKVIDALAKENERLKVTKTPGSVLAPQANL